MNFNQSKKRKVTIYLSLLLLINLFISVAYAQNPELIFIEAGNFDMGYNYDETGTWWYPTETPVHTVYISDFYMDKFEIFGTQWFSVYSWANDNGYSFDNVGDEQAGNHPIYNINWYDVVKWCNALHLFIIPIQRKTRFIETGRLTLIITQ
ncbi:MAG: formylglycine-generating enzyme family protein [Candidatus Cloacimonetes bacterium]|nr:formylglycine-generating enzyme family protein [Candidatus Cloacimonadota bacterium]